MNISTDPSTDIDLSKRKFLQVGAGAALGSLVIGTTGCPFDGVSKEKAIKVAGLIIGLAGESVPLLNLLGAKDLAITVDAKVIPALEKLKDALEDADIPSSQTMLQNVRSALNLVRQGLANLPESPRLITIMGIITSVNMLLLTVEAFINSETPAPAPSLMATTPKPRVNVEAIKKAYEASWMH